MKWIGLVALLAMIIPLSQWMRRNPDQSPKLWMLFGALPFLLSVLHLYMAVISWPEWPGYVKGLEFNLLDALALAFYLSFPRAQNPLPFRLPMALYFAATLVAAAVSQVPMAAMFYSWQLLRVFLVYATVARGCAVDPRATPSLLNGMALGVLFEAGASIWQRFALGIIQAGGTIGHQNFLGLLSHMIVFPFFALLLAGQRGWLPGAVVLAGLAIEVLTTSRATIGLAGFGICLLFVLSAFRGWTPRKARVLTVALAALVVLVPLALMSFEHRFASEEASDYDERAAFKRAAAMILSDHPLGVGANNYVLAANGGGYNNAAGVAATFGSDSAHVHNVYYLVGAETGYLGLVSFVLLILGPAIVAFLCGWRNRTDIKGDLLLGLGVGLLLVYLHSMFEWVFVVYVSQYLFAIDIGMVAAIAAQLGYWRRVSPQGVHRKMSLMRVE